MTVPSGHVYIVKQLTSYGNPLLNVQVFFEQTAGAVGTPSLWAIQHTGLAASWFGFYGHLVFLPGETFRFQVNAGPGDAADVSAHGYDLLS